MKVRSFQEMLIEYNITDLDSDDKKEREKTLSKLKYSVIVEGEWTEFDNLDKWVKNNLNIDTITDLFYGKTDYDYGFREIFFEREECATKLTNVIPNIYTIYPKSNIPNDICKSDGYQKSVNYDPVFKDAIVFHAEG